MCIRDRLSTELDLWKASSSPLVASRRVVLPCAQIWIYVATANIYIKAQFAMRARLAHVSKPRRNSQFIWIWIAIPDHNAARFRWEPQPASSMSRSMRSLIIFFTLWNGSSATRVASADKTRLLSLFACALKYLATRDCA